MKRLLVLALVLLGVVAEGTSRGRRKGKTERLFQRKPRRYISPLSSLDDRVRENRYVDRRRLRKIDRGNSFGEKLHARVGKINSRLRRLSKRAYRPQVKYPKYSAALRPKKQVIEARAIDIVDSVPLHTYNIYLLPMGRRIQAQIPAEPDQISTSFEEYKVNMNGRFFEIQCKKSHPNSQNQLICDYRSKKMMSKYSPSTYIPQRHSAYYYLKKLKKAPENDSWRKYLKVV